MTPFGHLFFIRVKMVYKQSIEKKKLLLSTINLFSDCLISIFFAYLLISYFSGVFELFITTRISYENNVWTVPKKMSSIGLKYAVLLEYLCKNKYEKLTHI